ncbi:orotidine-5'-phosphate decarboxylase [Methanobrevibacter curvatus]|uniref:Orotidine 5'-phosphate decarboxylase n=1 Tax=Methanobrevibacter curvatus TaxID=49547 RepID=A0A166B0K9_9EURY|nr:orotidine-5'-phosphate decarboxylase [Methanobrevibacter curvatus]KZX12712.1 3-hexulose-6-phosphate synthase [Methanobrevibacter curvatus]
MEVKNNIILALDLMDIIKSFELVESISKYINTIKIGYPLTLAEGLKSVTVFKENFEFNTICDYKVADIPATNEKIADLTFKAGADSIIVHGFVGKDSVAASCDVALEYGKEIFLLTEMSHPGAIQFLKGKGEKIAEMGLELGINNYVAPSTHLDRLSSIRSVLGKDKFIISPGVGTQGGNPNDTLKYADALIIGRSIYNAENPEIAIKEIIKEITV